MSLNLRSGLLFFGLSVHQVPAAPVTAMMVVKVAGDGDCLFHALAHLAGNNEPGSALRMRLANYMEEHAMDQQPEFQTVWFEEAESLRAGEWGGMTAVTAYSHMANVRVMAHTRLPNNDMLVEDYAHEDVGEASIIHILYNGDNHYDALEQVTLGPDMVQAWPQPPPPRYVSPAADDFPPLQACCGAKRRCRKGLAAARPAKKGKAKKQAHPATSAAGSLKDVQEKNEEVVEEEVCNRLLQELEAIPVTETSLHPHRHVEDLIEERLIIVNKKPCGSKVYGILYNIRISNLSSYTKIIL